jgi:hypothetical protein
MNQKSETKNRPLYRVSFARKTGVDDKGNDTLGPAREIGSVWPRRDGKGGILRLDHIPVELTHNNGVMFLFPTETADGGY